MDFGFPTIYYCPSCGKKMKMENVTSYTVSSSKYYSDGDVYESGICCAHLTPELTKCPHCDALFFRRNAKSEETSFITNTSKINDILEPCRADLISAVKNKIAKNKDEEKAIREVLWHEFNKETRYGNDILTGNDLKSWQDNCAVLLSLTEKTLKEMQLKKNSKQYRVSDRDDCVFMIAELNRNLGNFDKCMELFKELGSRWSWLKRQFAWECKAKNIFTFELITREEMNIEKSKDQYADDYYKRAKKFLQNYGRKSFKKALADYNKAESLGMRGTLFYEERGLLYLDELNDPDSAIADFSKALKQKDDFRESSRTILFFNRSNAYLKKGSLKKALTDIQTAIKEESDDERMYTTRSKIYEAMGNVEAAESDKRKADEVYQQNLELRKKQQEEWEAFINKPFKVSSKKGIKDSGKKRNKKRNALDEI